MSTVVGQLEIQMMADIARLQRDMDSVKRSVDSTMRDVKRMADGAAQALSALGVGLSAAAAIGFTKGILDANAALDDMAEITGASVESLSALRQVARVSGEDMNNVAGAMTKLAKNLAGVDDESKGAGKALEAIGLTVQDIKQLKADEQLLAIAKALGQYDDAGNKAAVAQAVLGKTGAALLPYLKDLAEWGALNASVTAEQAADAELLQKTLARLKSDISDAGGSLVRDLIPYLQLVATEFRNAQQGANDFGASGGALKTIAETLIVLFSEVAFVFKGVGTEIGGIAAQIAFVAQGEFGKAAEVGRAMKADAEAARIEHDKFIVSVMALGDQVAKPAIPEATKKTLEYSSATEKAAKAAKEAALSTKDWHASIMQAFSDVIAWEESGALLEKMALDDARAWSSLTESVEAHALALETENARYGQTEAQIQQTVIARLEEARAMTDPAFTEHLAYLDKEIAARQRIVAASNDRSILDGNAAAAKKAADDWQRAADDINRSLTDAIMDGGKSGGELLQNYFKTLVLRPLVQMATQPLVNSVGSLLGSPAGAGTAAGGSGGNLLSTGNSLLNLGNMAQSGYAAGYSLATSGIGQSIGLSQSTAFFANAELGTEAIAAFSTELTSAGSALASFSAAVPYIAAAVAIYSMFSGGGGGAKVEMQGGDGGVGAYFRQDSGLDSVVRGIKADYAKTVAALGKQAEDLKLTIYGNMDPQGDAPDSAGFTLQAGAQERYTVTDFGRSNWTQPENLGLIAARAMVSALEVTDLGPDINAFLDKIIVRDLTLEKAQQAAQAVRLMGMLADDAPQVFRDITAGVDLMAMSAEEFKRVVADIDFADRIRKAFTVLGRDADDVTTALIGVAGGAERLAGNLSTYYESFYSQSERSTAGLKALSDQLKVIGVDSMPQTRDEFRALVDAQDLASESGRRTFSALLSVAGAFATLTEAAGEMLSTDLFRTRTDYLYAQATGIMPSYATGGAHPGGWAQVGEAGPELVSLPPSRIYSNTASKSLVDLTPIRDEMAALRSDFRTLGATLARASNTTGKIIDKWDVEGMPDVRAA